jgi:hypothetical protein
MDFLFVAYFAVLSLLFAGAAGLELVPWGRGTSDEQEGHPAVRRKANAIEIPEG